MASVPENNLARLDHILGQKESVKHVWNTVDSAIQILNAIFVPQVLNLWKKFMETKYLTSVYLFVEMVKKMDLKNVMMKTEEITTAVIANVKFRMDGFVQEVHPFKGAHAQRKDLLNLRFRLKEQ